MRFRVLCEQSKQITGEGDPSDGEFAKPSTRKHTQINGLQHVEDKQYFDVTAEVESDIYYLLCVEYQTGDSFSRHEGQIEFVGCYADESIADTNAKRIRQHYGCCEDDGVDEFTIRLVTETNGEINVHVPWVGFFERLERIFVQPVVVGGGEY